MARHRFDHNILIRWQGSRPLWFRRTGDVPRSSSGRPISLWVHRFRPCPSDIRLWTEMCNDFRVPPSGGRVSVLRTRTSCREKARFTRESTPAPGASGSLSLPPDDLLLPREASRQTAPSRATNGRRCAWLAQTRRARTDCEGRYWRGVTCDPWNSARQSHSSWPGARDDEGRPKRVVDDLGPRALGFIAGRSGGDSGMRRDSSSS